MANLLIALPMSNQLPSLVTPYMSGRARQSPNSRTAEKMVESGARARIRQPTNIRGMTILRRMSEAMVKGEKTVRKWRVQEGSNELKLAIFPVPKKQRSVYNICN